ncbi:5-formyltetrahydrofolate cyclo-ligase [Cocleimonas sp. KMM 6892]|uniref:5-formyltetrahydrofolate cyclo-ligase n=1 Tax=unclassified Cocleimonas TaxID=2639732 RepID=UPI002DB98D36|nr:MULTISPECIES: 5-formyltetrahydrofolate cyclo-ligase [unclassified Cocleimonas]MEB8430719.1 5-formyltetrahydrofolate cyclo-ligase [Cocleimonas sp. KMM 6892]MEC4714509.1 5-formyltetrahydrofolate cyclo-ligase [Cocleimonas sp. KMM 6895]MEC4743842.1 5-formyltetrahydrofolate cyclo-ligase [Cocleimonas sp. KMM 6896]
MEHQLRDSLKIKRSSLSKQSQGKKSRKIVETVISSDAYQHAKKIGTYYSVKGEADPADLIKLGQKEATNKTFYLPVLSSDKQQGLLFGELTPNTKFENNRFSIPEPIFEESDLISGEQLDFVLVPLLGFDKNGNRLGMGGGFYDRCFAFKKSTQNKTLLMGFAYDFQEIDELTPENWDVRLDLIATETQLIDLR